MQLEPGTVLAPTTPGQLLDRITILRIKVDRVADDARRRVVASELNELVRIFAGAVPDPSALAAMVDELQKVNGELWEVEDQLRQCESNKDFGAFFVELARSVYRLNDRRYEIKRQIDVALGSLLPEQKIYKLL